MLTVVAILLALVGLLAFYVERTILDLVTPPIARGWLTAPALIALVVAGIEVVHREAQYPD